MARALAAQGYTGTVGMEAFASGDSDVALQRFRDAQRRADDVPVDRVIVLVTRTGSGDGVDSAAEVAAGEGHGALNVVDATVLGGPDDRDPAPAIEGVS